LDGEGYMDKKLFRILVVDDEEDVGSVLGNYLPKKLHVEVSTLTDGNLVVDKVKAWKPDLILLDIHLPGLMGWDVLREIRQFDTAVKIVIVTAIFAVPPEDQEFILQETSGYLTKPMEIDNIRAKIIEVLGPQVVKR
jgi:two-component system response regulator (stage 0 sporulation protein F)